MTEERALREALEALLLEWIVRKNERVYPYGRRMEVFGNDAYARCVEEVEALLRVERPQDEKEPT